MGFNNNIIGLMLCLLLAGTNLFSQDPVYSQFYNAPIELNPAFAGTSHAPTFAINYRNQWPAISNVYQTYSASYDQFSERYNSGFGVSILGDSAGDGAIKTFRIAGQYAYAAEFNDEIFFKVGIEPAFVQTRLDWDKFSFPDQIDPEFGSITPGGTPYPTDEVRPDNLTNSFFDLSTGILVYNKRFYLGATAKHINGPNDNVLNSNIVNGLPTRISFHAGSQFILKRRNKRSLGSFITPNVLFVKQADFIQLIGGAYTSYENFFIGAWYRHAWGNPDAVIASMGVKTGVFKIGYSFDYTVSDLSIGTGGSHELGILIQLEDLYPKRSKLNDCLQLFR